jgi:hypothetical protein
MTTDKASICKLGSTQSHLFRDHVDKTGFELKRNHLEYIASETMKNVFTER